MLQKVKLHFMMEEQSANCFPQVNGEQTNLTAVDMLYLNA